MLETSKDVLYIVLSFCVLWLTIFLSWLLYYIIKVFRNANKAINKTWETVEKIDDFVDVFKEKLNRSTSNLLFLAELAKQGMEFMRRKKESQDSQKKKKTKKTLKK